MDGQRHTQAIASLKVLNGDVWIELLVTSPLSKGLIRDLTVQLETLKTALKNEGYHEIKAGCSDELRVKWTKKLFGFEKIQEVTVGDKVWHVVSLCF